MAQSTYAGWVSRFPGGRSVEAWPKGHYEILTPEVPFTIKFQTWHRRWVDRKAFDESGVQIETIQLDLGARREMTIRLN